MNQDKGFDKEFRVAFAKVILIFIVTIILGTILPVLVQSVFQTNGQSREVADARIHVRGKIRTSDEDYFSNDFSLVIEGIEIREDLIEEALIDNLLLGPYASWERPKP